MKADNYNHLLVSNKELVTNFKNELKLFFKIYEVTNKILEDFNITYAKVDDDFKRYFDVEYLQEKTGQILLEMPIPPVAQVAQSLGFYVEKEDNFYNETDNLIPGKLDRANKSIIIFGKSKYDDFEEKYIIAKMLGEYFCGSEIEEENLRKKEYIEYVSDLFALMLIMPPKKLLLHQIAYIKQFWERQMIALIHNKTITLSKDLMLRDMSNIFRVRLVKFIQYQSIIERMLYISRMTDFPDFPLKQELNEMYNDPNIANFYDPKPIDLKTKYEQMFFPERPSVCGPCKPHYFVGSDGRAR